MSTATATSNTIVSQPQRERTFTARREDLRLVKTARYPILNAQGAKTGTETPGVTLQFRGGLLRLPLEGEVLTEHGVPVDAGEILAWLEGHRLNGDRFEGFIELEQAAPPVTAEEMKALIRLGQAFDEDGLEAFIEQERAGWDRAELIESAQASLAGARELREEGRRLAQEEAAQAQQASAKPARKPAQG